LDTFAATGISTEAALETIARVPSVERDALIDAHNARLDRYANYSRAVGWGLVAVGTGGAALAEGAGVVLASRGMLGAAELVGGSSIYGAAGAAGAAGGSVNQLETEIEDLEATEATALQAATTEGADAGPPQFVYRTGSQTENSLTDEQGVSFRDSLSSSANREQVFDPGAKVYAVDTRQLPPGSVVFDGNPAGHVSVFASPAEIQSAIVPQGPANPLFDFGMKALQDGSSYRIPK